MHFSKFQHVLKLPLHKDEQPAILVCDVSRKWCWKHHCAYWLEVCIRAQQLYCHRIAYRLALADYAFVVGTILDAHQVEVAATIEQVLQKILWNLFRRRGPGLALHVVPHDDWSKFEAYAIVLQVGPPIQGMIWVQSGLDEIKQDTEDVTRPFEVIIAPHLRAKGTRTRKEML